MGKIKMGLSENQSNGVENHSQRTTPNSIELKSLVTVSSFPSAKQQTDRIIEELYKKGIIL